MNELKANFVLEILGRPKEHIEGAIASLIEKLGKENGIKVKESKVHEAMAVQDAEDLFTTFAELEVEFKSIENYLVALFAYMPSHVEIIEPEKISLTNTYFNDIGNMLLQRLHNYDAITKKTIVDRELLIQKLKEVAPEELNKMLTPQKASHSDITDQKTKMKKHKKSSSVK